MARLVREPASPRSPPARLTSAPPMHLRNPNSGRRLQRLRSDPLGAYRDRHWLQHSRSKKDKLQLSGPVLAEIYMGKITNWSNPKIKKLNPGIHLPKLTITPVFRSDGSGDPTRSRTTSPKSIRPGKTRMDLRHRSTSRPGSEPKVTPV